MWAPFRGAVGGGDDALHLEEGFASRAPVLRGCWRSTRGVTQASGQICNLYPRLGARSMGGAPEHTGDRPCLASPPSRSPRRRAIDKVSAERDSSEMKTGSKVAWAQVA